MEADIQPGAFNGSSFSLETFHIETANSNRNKILETGAFSKLQALHTVDLGNSFGTIQRKAFFDLPNLQLLSVDKMTLIAIETEAFDQLPKLNTLDLSQQNIDSLPARTFCNLSNLTKLDLSMTNIKRIQEYSPN